MTHTGPFLRALRTMLASPASWHPSTCANVYDFPLHEFEQVHPGQRWCATWNVPVRWNLTCAIRYLCVEWEVCGLWPDKSVDQTHTRLDAWARLCAAAGVSHLDRIHEHARALAAIDRVLADIPHA